MEVSDGLYLNDVVRFFKGDAVSCQAESGQQKGGKYFCWTCGIRDYRTSDYAHAAYRPWWSLKDRQEKVLSSECSTEKSNAKYVKLYSNLKKEDLLKELRQRKVKHDETDLVPDLRYKLDRTMMGIQRVPTLLFNDPTEDLENVGLGSYEILACEPLHDITNHIENIFKEIPTI